MPSPAIRITSYNVCYTKLLRLDQHRGCQRGPVQGPGGGRLAGVDVITSYSIHYTKLYDILNPTLSGGSVWGAGHLAVFDVTVDTLPGATIAKALLNGRNPAYGSAVDVVANRCGVTIGGAAAGSLSLPATDGRYGADVLAAMAQGSLARVVDDLDSYNFV